MVMTIVGEVVMRTIKTSELIITRNGKPVAQLGPVA
jgi:antitoxin (DNA-binding transcriptional repressor) of toxin-antitoxin stability system